MYSLSVWCIILYISVVDCTKLDIESLGCYRTLFLKDSNPGNKPTVDGFFENLPKDIFPYGTSASDAKFDSKHSNDELLVSNYLDFWYLKRPSNSTSHLLPLSPYLGEGIDVYILDGFVDVNHPEFDRAEQIFSIYDQCKKYDYSHGTSIASIVKGSVCGLAKSSTIYSISLCDCEENRLETEIGEARSMELIHILKGISEVVNHREKLHKQQPNVQRKCIVNLSLGLELDSEQMAFVARSLDRLTNDPNVLIIAAAGNSGISTKNIWPASDHRVISVGAYGPSFDSAPFTNFDADISGPGEDVLVADAQGLWGYRKKSGTSVACPFISGLAAAIWSVFTDWRANQVKTFVINYMSK